MLQPESKRSPRWHILGAGAMGRLWAAYLKQAGYPVTLLVKSRGDLAGLKPPGRIILETQQTSNEYFIDTCTTANLNEPITHLLVCTKAPQAYSALQSISSCIDQSTLLLLMTNGMGFQQSIADYFPGTPVYCASTTEGAYQSDGNRIVHAGHGHTVVGKYPHGQYDSQLQKLVEALPGNFLSIDSSTYIFEKLWHKLAVNCAINGLTALYQCQNGALLDIPEAADRIAVICSEIQQVLLALNIKEPEQGMEKTVYSVIRSTASNTSSMLQDIMRHKKTEIDYLNGYVCNQAETLGLACKANQLLVTQIKELETSFH
jgi:2-dehydropantoate 2-reductase